MRQLQTKTPSPFWSRSLIRIPIAAAKTWPVAHVPYRLDCSTPVYDRYLEETNAKNNANSDHHQRLQTMPSGFIYLHFYVVLCFTLTVHFECVFLALRVPPGSFPSFCSLCTLASLPHLFLSSGRKPKRSSSSTTAQGLVLVT